MNESSTSHSSAFPRERLRSLEAFLEADPANPQLFKQCAALATELQAFDVLARIAEARLRGQPEDSLAASARAQAWIAAREYQRAADILEQFVRRPAADAALQQDLGLCYFCLGEYERAKPPLESAYRAGPPSSGLLRLLVSTYHHLGCLAEAVAIADANAEPALSDAALSGTYALLYLDTSRPTDAARWATAALALDRECIDALTVEGTLSLASGTPDQARGCFAHVLARAPQTGRAWIGLGTIALLQQDFPRALEHLNRGVQLMPRHVGSWHVLAWTYLLAGDLPNAEEAFQEALALDRNFAETHGGLAAVAALRGDAAAAKRGLETALRLDPACLSAQFTRSVLAGRGGDARQAREIVLIALSRLTSDPAMAFARRLIRRPLQ